MGAGATLFWVLLTNYKLKFKGFSNFKNLEIFFNKKEVTKLKMYIANWKNNDPKCSNFKQD
jgi:hypothetical protein